MFIRRILDSDERRGTEAGETAQSIQHLSCTHKEEPHLIGKGDRKDFIEEGQRSDTKELEVP